MVPPLRRDQHCYGFKEPHAMWFLPSLKAQFPTLRIVHIVRDARDIAWSSQQVRLQRETRHTHASEKA